MLGVLLKVVLKDRITATSVTNYLRAPVGHAAPPSAFGKLQGFIGFSGNAKPE
jgi:hypothetical protein